MLVRLIRLVRDRLGLNRGWQGWFIVVFVAIQMLAPLHFYWLREDRRDERFAWRMFSPTRNLPDCAVRATANDAPVDLYGTFHEAWIAIAKRGRMVVLEAMGEQLCRELAGKDVRMVVRCEMVGGAVREDWTGNVCDGDGFGR